MNAIRIFIFFLCFYLSFNTIQAQLPTPTTDFRGIWVTKFRTEVLGNTIAENNLLSYAQDYDFNYLICTNMFQILGAECGSFTTEMEDLKLFIAKAHNTYGISMISGNVGSAATASKLESYNNCAFVSADQKFDMITYECEFYNSATNSSCADFDSYYTQLSDIKNICNNTAGSNNPSLICEVYIGGSGSTGHVVTNSSEVEIKQIADIADHMLVTYYRSTPFASMGNFFNWTIQRLEWIASSTATPNNVVLLFKSRDSDSNNMYDYIADYVGSHHDAVRDPYHCWVEGTTYDVGLTPGYTERYDDGTYPWLSGIKIQGFTWFEHKANLEIEETILPIELSSFNVVLSEGNKVLINWSINAQLNNDYYTILRSKDGIEWDEIYKIPSKINNRGTLFYSVTDYKPYLGKSYYKLMQTDTDGKFSYSDIKSLYYSFDLEINRLFPNPSNGIISIYSDKKTEGLPSIFDWQGREVSAQISSTIQETQFGFTLDTSKLLKGIYIVEIGGEYFKLVKI